MKIQSLLFKTFDQCPWLCFTMFEVCSIFLFTQQIFIECLLLPGMVPNARDKVYYSIIFGFKMHIFSHFNISELECVLQSITCHNIVDKFFFLNGTHCGAYHN